MALIKCPECGRKVSTESTRCHNCGYPFPEIKEKQIKFNTNIEDTSTEKSSFEQAKITKTIRCNSCGIEIAEGANFCYKCGCNLYGGNTTLNNGQYNAETPIVVESSDDVSKRHIKTKSCITAVAGTLAILIIAILLFPKNNIENDVKKILENDLGSSVKITALYYNEDKQGCLVEFETKSSSDVAAIHLDTKKIDYKSEFNYYSDKAERLRKQRPIDEQALHNCNKKILESSYSDWNFAITVMKVNGETEKNGWKKIK